MACESPVSVLSRRARYALAVFLYVAGTLAAVADQAGSVVAARGLVTAHVTGGTPRIVGRDSVIFEGDVLTTGARSIAVLKLLDGTRITLRPDTVFQIREFKTEETKESALFSLFKGGLRAVTGFVSKRNPNAVRLRTSVATIGIRGTEFDARLCGADCQAEAKLRPAPAGRAGFVKGQVVAHSAGGRARQLAVGQPVYNGESLVTSAGSYAVIGFRDKSRVTLLPDTEFRVDKLAFDEQQPKRDEGVFSLLRGGLRAVSGLIGHRGGRGYQMRTAVATIGIRGTEYYAVCEGVCQNPAAEAGTGPGGGGLFAEVIDGQIALDDNVVDAGQTVFLANTGLQPVPVPDLPIDTSNVPAPADIDIPEPPPAESSTNPQDGLYVSCYAGECAVETPQNTVALKPGDAGFVGVGGGEAAQLEEIPPFQAEDPVLQAVEIGESLNQLNESLGNGASECTVN